MQEVPGIFATGSLPEEKILSRFREARRLQQLKLLFSLGLREICDAVLVHQRITDFSLMEIERIVEARFEKTQLRDSIMKSIARGLEKS